jgi:hypothetical protein
MDLMRRTIRSGDAVAEGAEQQHAGFVGSAGCGSSGGGQQTVRSQIRTTRATTVGARSAGSAPSMSVRLLCEAQRFNPKIKIVSIRRSAGCRSVQLLSAPQLALHQLGDGRQLGLVACREALDTDLAVEERT